MAEPRQHFLNTYRPLVWTAAGHNAADEFGLSPFIDGSIRREPDLAHRFPSITCLCRADRFAPRIRIGDLVGYMTVKHRYGDEKSRHRRLTSLLRAWKLFDSHREAAEWYRDRKLKLPSNLMVPGNKPDPISHTVYADLSDSNSCGDRRGCGSNLLREWDKEYADRARCWGRVVVCQRIFRNLEWSCPVVTDKLLESAFGEIPGTQNPGNLDRTQFIRFLSRLKPPVSLSSR